MSVNGSGGSDSNLAMFTDLETEGGGEQNTPTKLEQIMTLLSENLEPDVLREFKKLAGLKTDMTNEELYAELTKFLQKKKKDENDDEEKEEKDLMDRKEFMSKCMKGGKSLAECAEEYKKESPEKAAAFLVSYKDYLSKCMKDGKSLAECATAWKKKYPEPSEKETKEAGIEELAKKFAKKKKDDDEEEEYPEPIKKAIDGLKGEIKDLQDQLAAQSTKAELAEVTSEVNKLREEKHLSPKQVEAAIKLGATMDAKEREELFDLFRTQKFTALEDVGLIRDGQPGARPEITAEERAKILDKHGLRGLIADKADNTVAGAWWRENN